MKNDVRRDPGARKRTETMHKYRVGDSVRLSRGRFADRAGSGIYEIVRLLPESDGEYQYRIRAAGAQNERMVREGEIERA
jgi:hypothetical protein